MGQSGYNILDSDEAMDSHAQYLAQHEAGKSAPEINEWFRQQFPIWFEEAIIEDNSNFWLGLALAQWEHKSLSPFVLARVQEIVDTDTEAEIWGSKYPKRKEILKHFLQQIQTDEEIPAPKMEEESPEGSVFSPFKTGEVIAYKLPNKHYGAAICLFAATEKRPFPTCIICITRINQKGVPTLKEVLNSHVAYREDFDYLIFNYLGMENHLKESKKFLDKCKIIGSVSFKKDFSLKHDYPHFFGYRIDDDFNLPFIIDAENNGVAPNLSMSVEALLL